MPLDELRAGFRQGPQSDAERIRRDRQALTIHQLIDEGATQRAISRVFGLGPGRISEQAALGRKLAQRVA